VIAVPPISKTGTDWLRRQAARVGEQPTPAVDTQTAMDAMVEEWLQGHGVEYAPATELPMALIDEKKSRLNQARRDALVDDSVARFAASYKADKPLPPIVTFINGGRLVVIDGNNRQAGAKKASQESIRGITIAEDTPSELIQLLTVEANAHHGVTPDLAWRLQQAFQLVSLGFSDLQAASAASVTTQQIQNARRVQEVDQLARQLQIKSFTELPTYARQALAVLVKDHPVFYQAAKVAISTAMTIDEIREMTRGIKRQGSESQKIDFIGEIAKDRGLQQAQHKAAGRTLHRLNSPKIGLYQAIGKIANTDEAALIRNIKTRHDRDVMIERLKELEEKLLAIQVAVDQLTDLEDE
jgi:hypothetical protein